MTQIKIFHAKGPTTRELAALEEKCNAWLIEHDKDILVVGTEMNRNESGTVLLLLYEELRQNDG